MRVSAGKTRFEKYPGFHFDDESKRFDALTETLFESRLDDKGEARIPLKINIKDAPGMLNVHLKTRVFERGGDFSVDRITVPYSPFVSYAGLRIPEGRGWNGALYSDREQLIPVVTVDENGHPVSRRKLHVEVFEIQWRWWWQRTGNEDLGYYLRSRHARKIIDDYMSTKNGKGIYSLRFPQQTFGRKFIRITDPVSGHSTGKVFYTDYPGWWDQPGHGAPGGAEMLTFSTDKDKYRVGETVHIKLPKARKGKALISIENGNRVLETFWMDTEKEKDGARFVITDDMAPNVYVHISYIQPHERTDNDRPIRLYGIKNIEVENPDTHLEPVLEVADELRPETEVTLRVREKKGRPMTYSVFVVDEGLLSLTRFRTPDPWSHFFAREALGVRTYDMYKYVLGAFHGRIAGLLAVGGDADLVLAGEAKINRFKPVVKFIGTFTTGKNQSRTHRFRMPNYVGAVRTMVVAASPDKVAYGSVSKTSEVKKPLMVLATAPRVLAPAEETEVAVTVFAMKPAVKKVTVRVSGNELTEWEGARQQQVRFDKPGEKTLHFRLKVKKRTGAARIKVTAQSGNEKARYEIEIPVSVRNPRITRTHQAVLHNPGEVKDWTYTPFGLKGTNKTVLEVSVIPPIGLENRLNYLITYPHGCVEQTVSSVFPQLYLTRLTEVEPLQQARIKDHILAGLDRLKTFQTSGGGFAYWPGGTKADDWATSYAGHFMLEARRLGYPLPPDMLEKWLHYQTRRAAGWSDNPALSIYLRRSRQTAQAYRLFTLALAGKPALAPMNRMREIESLYPATKWLLIGAYALAGKKNTARSMMKETSVRMDGYRNDPYTYGDTSRDNAIILYVLSLLGEDDKAAILLEQVAKDLASDQWLSTQTTAYSLMAVAAYAGKHPGHGTAFKYTLDGKTRSVESGKSLMQLPLPARAGQSYRIAVESKTEGPLFVKLIQSGIPLESPDAAENNNLEMNLRYYDTNGNPVDPASIKQGTDFIAEIRITHPGTLPPYRNMALTYLFPSGWELTNARLDNIRRWKSSPADYRDIRDDRVMTYFDLQRGETKTYRFLFHAAYPGRYYLPSVQCEAMYDHRISALTGGKWVEVMP